ncbi:MAG: FtsX-like permease family protein, partial [Acidobacteriota bacterium]
ILQEELIADVATTLYLLWGGVVVVLVVGAVNVANLASIRATAQSRELATRAALGASVGRLSRQLLTEALMLATVGALAGLVLGAWALRASPLLGFDRLPRGDEISLDALTLVAVGALVLVVGLGVGLLPIQVLRRTNLAQSVREEGRSGTATRATQVTRRGLVTVQVASALVLLTGAGLLMASFQRVLAINPGFQADRVLSGWVSLPASRYAEPAQLRAQALRLLEGVRSVPGVTSAGLSTTLPLGGGYSDSVIIAEGYQMAPGESLISPNDIVVSEGFFESLQIRLVEGRFFDARDAEYPPRVMIVDEQLANRFWKGQSAVGRRLYHPGSPDRLLAPPPEDEWFTVVGVVESVRLAGMTDTEEFQRVGAYYAPYPQRPARTFSLAIRSAGDPAALVNTVRAAIAQADPELPFFDVQTLADRVDRSLVDRRTPMVLAAGFAGAALFLAAVGLYGVLAYQVAQRRREIGVRLALGADGRDIFSMVLWEGALIVGVGAVMGLAGAFFLRELWASQLYEVGSMDPRVVAGVSVLLAIVALVACLLPARRAASTDPIAALQAP